MPRTALYVHRQGLPRERVEALGIAAHALAPPKELLFAAHCGNIVPRYRYRGASARRKPRAALYVDRQGLLRERAEVLGIAVHALAPPK